MGFLKRFFMTSTPEFEKAIEEVKQKIMPYNTGEAWILTSPNSFNFDPVKDDARSYRDLQVEINMNTIYIYLTYPEAIDYASTYNYYKSLPNGHDKESCKNAIVNYVFGVTEESHSKEFREHLWTEIWYFFEHEKENKDFRINLFYKSPYCGKDKTVFCDELKQRIKEFWK